MFGEVDSPFFLDTVERARKLKLYKIPLKYDIIVDMEIGWSSGDWMIDEYAEKVNFTCVKSFFIDTINSNNIISELKGVVRVFCEYEFKGALEIGKPKSWLKTVGKM